jgi:two-component system, NarL family, nitrate/nitrite response regulator NarL
MSNPESLQRLQGKRCIIACAAIAANVCGALRRLCSNSSTFEFCGNRTSTTLLVRAFSRQHPNIVLMGDELLRHRGLAELALLHSALPKVRTILVGDSLDSMALLSAVRLGTCGMLAAVRATLDLERALRAVAAGELWFSRQQLARLMMLTSVAPSDDIPILTPRENAVMHKALLGHSNKEIASALNIAEQTVKIHLQHVYGKLHVHSRIELLLSFHRDSAR